MICIEKQPNNICTVGWLNVIVFITTDAEYNDLRRLLSEHLPRHLGYWSMTPCFHRLSEDKRKAGRYYLDYDWRYQKTVFAALMAAARELEDNRANDKHPPMKIIKDGKEVRLWNDPS